MFAPLLVLTGVAAGHWMSDRRPARVWRDPSPQPRLVAIPSLAPIVRKVRGGVVGIRAITRARGHVVATADEGERVPTSRRSQGVQNGTGFVINRRGLVVTNHHLVSESDEIVVEIPGGYTRNGVLVGEDPVTDIAVLRLEDPPPDLCVLELADSDSVEQGDYVMALGNPYQYRQTLTAGVVSYVGRHIPEEGLLVSNEYLQFDAPVNPGSSGGPVVDMNGHVVGVTTSAHRVANGISFAVPSNIVKWVLGEMEHSGRVQRGFLGIRIEPVDAALGQGLGLRRGEGALIRRVNPGTPAARAGLADGDVVVAYNGKPVPDAYALFDWITYSAPGSTAALEVIRGGRRLPALVAQLGAVEHPDWEELEPATEKTDPSH